MLQALFLSSLASSQSKPYESQNSRQFVGVMLVKSMSAEQSAQTSPFLTSTHPDGSQNAALLVGEAVVLGVGSEVVGSEVLGSEVVGSEVVGKSAGAGVGIGVGDGVGMGVGGGVGIGGLEQ
jgi:hypothetical protein